MANSQRKCPGRTAKGGLKKGFKLVKGEKCPIKVTKSPKSKSTRKNCDGVTASGPNKGKLKKGFTWRGSNGGCPVKAKG